jgi:branched-chain amino acid aminotransferase
VIWTDSKTHEFVEEAGTMNIFFRIDDTLITAPTSDRILHGVTRESLIRLAEDNGIEVDVRRLTVDEVMDAARDGRLQEIFGSGTAATVLPIIGIGYRNEYYDLPKPKDSHAARLKKMLMDIQYNRAPDPYGWRVPVVTKS